MTKSNKFEHLEITDTFLVSFDKIGKFGTLKDTIIGFKLEGKNLLKKLTVHAGLVQVLRSCSQGHDTVPLCIISHQNKQIMESFEFRFP